MEPTTSLYLGVKAAFGAGKTFAAADAQVAAAAEEYGISKKEAWAAVRAEARKRNDESLQSLLRGEDVVGSVLDLADPLGWRAAAKAMEQSERDRNS
jgi:adenosylmethionine-8-amino-7-oxononanoate aminotransferase